MTLIADVLARDPRTWSIPNVGVAKVGQARTPEEQRVLRYELQSFVAEGEYEAGLERILTSYLTNLDRDSQPAAWVSGFFGSGKSHLVKVLAALWSDVSFDDGARATGLVSLPPDLAAQFRELRTRGVQAGGIFSAAGTLSAGGTSAALSFLEIVLDAANLPTHLPAAKLVLWLRRVGLLDAVVAELGRRDKELHDVLRDMYVSRDLADAILAADPTYAPTAAEVRSAIRQQFPNEESVSDDDFIETLNDVLTGLGTDGKIPLTLIVLDELQQFVAQDSLRTLEVQQLVEAVSSKFGSRVLFVATGQMALSSTTSLQKLQDRFTVTVTLRDTDVDRVVRSVVLRKKPEHEAEVRAVLERFGGEISRQLAGSAIAPSSADATDLVTDYPLLPSRRRFWDRVLREMDATGRSAKLRTQLRIILEATGGVADRDVGVVVGGDAIYDQLHEEFLSSGMLPRETASLIADVNDGTEQGRLQARVAKLTLLIGRLPKDGARPSGIQATNDMLADLLVEDLERDGARLRADVPIATAALVRRGLLDDVGGAYLLQTPTSAEWAADYEMYRREADADEPWIAAKRAEHLRLAIESSLQGYRPTQGDSKEARRYRIFYGDEDPAPDASEVPVWVRDGWGTSEARVVERARDAGQESPWVFAYIPRERHDDLRAALIESRAAATTVERRAAPTTEEGRQARAAVITRREAATAAAATIVREIAANARVFQGGGTEVEAPSPSGGVGGALKRAIDNAVLRMFPQFHIADQAGWPRVRDLAKSASPTPFSAVGHQGEANDQPVAKAVLAQVAPSGTRGLEIQKTFGAPPYGWSKDAIDGALLALAATDHVECRLNGVVTAPKAIQQNSIGTVEFRRQTVRATVSQRMAVRALAQELGIKLQGQDDQDLPSMIARRLEEFADAAGGAPPLPGKPSVERLRELTAEVGPRLIIAFAEADAELRALWAEWVAAADDVAARTKQWETAERLLRHASQLPVYPQAAQTLTAIEEGRTLLEDPDPVGPVVSELCDSIRAALGEQWDVFNGARAKAITDLERSPDWQALDEAQRAAILSEAGLGDSTAPAMGSPDDLLRSLDLVPLNDWQYRTQAIPAQAGNALAKAAAAGEAQPVEVHAPRTVIRSTPELDAYLDRLRADVQTQLDDGKAVIV
jgi:hypothetical protein